MDIILVSIIVSAVFIATYSYFVGYRHAKEDYEDLYNHYVEKILKMQEGEKK